jgi:biotin transporter BioY
MSAYGPAAVYILCLLASAACAGLLVRSWRRTRAPLLLWTAICFVLLAFNNLFLVADMLVFADIDLRLVRHGTALAAVGVLIYGFVRETS